MGVLTFASNRSRRDEPWQEDEDEVDADVAPRFKAAVQDDEDVLLAAPRAPADHAAPDAADPLLAKAAAATDAALTSAAAAAGVSAVASPAPTAASPAVTAAVSAAPPAPAATPAFDTSASVPTFSAPSAPASTSAVPVAAAAVQTPAAVQATAANAFSASQQPAGAFAPATVQPAAPAEPPRYRFDVPQEPAAPAFTGWEEDEGPQMGNWRDADMTATASATAAAAAQASSSPLFDIVPETNHNPQVKQGIGPALPRPNPVKLPTRRELASYGIKLPSQRMAEEKAKAQEQQRAEAEQPAEAHAEWSEQQQQAEEQAQLRDAFASQQQQRYGESWQQEEEPEAEEAIEQAALAQQFAAQQQQRYGAEEQEEKTPAFSLDTSAAFDFSPMKDLVDEGPNEPIFTIASAPEPEAPAATHTPWQQPAEAAAAQPAVSVAAPTVSTAFEPAAAFAPAAEPEPTPAFQTSAPAAAQPTASQPASLDNSLIHPFLMRHNQPLEKPSTPLPTLDLLTSPPAEEEPVDMFALEQTARLVEARLGDYRVKAEVVGISPGPVITRFELDLAPGVKAARISNLSRDLARSLSAVAVRVVEVIPGKPYVGLGLPNKHRQTVYLREVLDCAKFRDNPSPLAVVLGKDIAGQPVVADLAKMPHLLVAGTTGSGKSVGVNTMIISMLYKATPEEVRFIMIDPKMLELSVYEGIPHLLTEVVTDMKDAANALRWSVGEMERRYKLMSALGVRNLAGYNEKVEQAEAMGRPIPDPFWKPGDSMDMTPPVLEKLPYIVVLVDEFADLMMAVGKKVEELIARLAQKARAAGIHLVLATQRPSVDVITGLIKANIPTRIAFTVSSKIDSRTILDQGGAESLLGMGDMLYMPPNSSMPVRVHGAFVRDQEVHAGVQDWKARGRPQYIESITAGEESEGGAGGLEGDEELDPLFDQAVAFVVDKRRASISGVQRQFRIGYNRAARIIEQMEAQGIVSEPGHNGNREVLSPPPHEM